VCGVEEDFRRKIAGAEQVGQNVAGIQISRHHRKMFAMDAAKPSNSIVAARDTAKENERALWNAVDPENKLVMPGTPIAAARSGLRASYPVPQSPRKEKNGPSWTLPRAIRIKRHSVT
jgi:hypothetical protein